VDEGGIDCSGLVQNVMGELGAALPRTVRDQSRRGRIVERRDLAPGDLVFFRLDSGVIDHVGIALDANRFVHASSSRGVVIDRIMDRYFARRLAQVRRVLDDEGGNS
jgi:cell wall-associated NlpC family hydrolase